MDLIVLICDKFLKKKACSDWVDGELESDWCCQYRCDSKACLTNDWHLQPKINENNISFEMIFW